MIFEGSRYEDARLERIALDSTTVPTIFPRNPYRYAFEFREYRVREGDRLDLIAEQFYGDPNQWWQIMNANPQILYPDLEVGELIRIPHAASLH